MADAAPKRTRSRASVVTADRATVAQRVVDFYTKDVQDRSFDIDARLQRYAKFRMWREGKTWPWTRRLENQPGDKFHYPALTQGRDGTIHAVYSYFVKGGKSKAADDMSTEEEDGPENDANRAAGEQLRNKDAGIGKHGSTPDPLDGKPATGKGLNK